MPLVRIDMIKNVRSPSSIKKLADVVQDVMVEKFNAPPHDRYQIVTQHEPYEMVCEDSGLNFPRTNKLVIIQIVQQGRTTHLKEAVYAELQKQLEERCGLPGTDLIVSCVENQKEDWSFGKGRAQFLTGEL